MAEAPKSRGFGSLLGRSMGVAVEGIQPEIVRNRATPDAASQSGQPWPDDADDAPFWIETHNSSGGTVSSFSMDFTLPSEGIWLFTIEGSGWYPAADVTFSLTNGGGAGSWQSPGPWSVIYVTSAQFTGDDDGNLDMQAQVDFPHPVFHPGIRIYGVRLSRSTDGYGL